MLKILYILIKCVHTRITLVYSFSGSEHKKSLQSAPITDKQNNFLGCTPPRLMVFETCDHLATFSLSPR
jgi:hypothetical protein